MELRFRQGDENHPPEFAVTNCLLTDGHQPMYLLLPLFWLYFRSLRECSCVPILHRVEVALTLPTSPEYYVESQQSLAFGLEAFDLFFARLR